MADILIPLSFFATIVLIVYFAIQARNRQNKQVHDERMLAIEKGVDIPLLPATPENKKDRNPYVSPFVFIAIGLAMVIGNILEGDFELFWSFIPLFIGGGMLLAHYFFRKQHKRGESTSDESDDIPKEHKTQL